MPTKTCSAGIIGTTRITSAGAAAAMSVGSAEAAVGGEDEAAGVGTAGAGAAVTAAAALETPFPPVAARWRVPVPRPLVLRD
jgi:hypothetical protein